MDWSLIYLIAALLVLPALIYSIFTSSNVDAVFDKYSKELSKKGITAFELTNYLLKANNVNDVEVALINGKLTDCYDSKHKVLKLSSSTYNSTSIAALGVCAHEVGHAIQDNKRIFMFRLRQFVTPILSFITRAYLPLILIGSIFSFLLFVPVVGYYIILAGMISYGASLLFYLITVPLEHDASKRALEILKESEALDEDELKKAKQVLSAAIQTYLSALTTSLIYFLKFLSYIMMMNDRRR